MSTCCTPTNTITRAESPSSATGKGVSYFRPNVDVFESEAEFRIIADVPGATAESIELDFDKNTLTLTARVPQPSIEQRRHLLAEYQVGDYRRAFRFDEQVDADQASADLRDGVLTVRVPKSEHARRRKVPIRTN